MTRRLTSSAYADCEIERAVYVGVFKEMGWPWQQAAVSMDVHPMPCVRLETRASSVVTGAINAEVHRSQERSVSAGYDTTRL